MITIMQWAVTKFPQKIFPNKTHIMVISSSIEKKKSFISFVITSMLSRCHTLYPIVSIISSTASCQERMVWARDMCVLIRLQAGMLPFSRHHSVLSQQHIKCRCYCCLFRYSHPFIPLMQAFWTSDSLTSNPLCYEFP